MLRFLKLTKNPPNNQSPSAIPGFLFRDGREEDGFVIVGETDPVQHFSDNCRADMGSGSSTVEKTGLENASFLIDNNTAPRADWTKVQETVRDPVKSASADDSHTCSRDHDETGCQNFADCWKDIPFHLSEKYFQKPIQDIFVRDVSPIDLTAFQYDFSAERAYSSSINSVL